MTDIPENIYQMAKAVASEHGQPLTLAVLELISRGIQAERARVSIIAKEIIAKDIWRDHWEPDFMGGQNVRNKIKGLAET